MLESSSDDKLTGGTRVSSNRTIKGKDKNSLWADQIYEKTEPSVKQKSKNELPQIKCSGMSEQNVHIIHVDFSK
jgi:hypothetical protein